MSKSMFFVCLLLLGIVSANVNGASKLQDVSKIIFYESDTSGSVHIEGLLSSQVALGNEISASLEFFEKNKSALFLSDPLKELTVDEVFHDVQGKTHVKFFQFYNEVKVYSGQLITHFDNKNNIKTVNGDLIRNITVNHIPSITSSEAVDKSVADLKSFFGNGSAYEAELVVFPWEDKMYLAWNLFVTTDYPMGRWEYFIDAHTGEVIFKANRIMDSDEIGTGVGVLGTTYDHIDTDYNGIKYQMIDNTRQLNNNPHGHDGLMGAGSVIRTYTTSTSLPGTITTDSDNIWDYGSQAAAVDGHVYTGLVYDWMLSQFGRNSYNDNGTTMTTTVGYVAEGTNNAYWNGSQIVIWGASSGYNSLAASPDVIAHEWGHAITSSTSNLIYQKESGALNESFSDMIGAAFEFAHPEYDNPDWFMGENISATSSGFRDIAFPHNKFDPDTYGEDDPYWVTVEPCTPSNTNDWCGVHTNSGVGNKWFYLLSDGGTHNGVTVDGIGVANAIKVAYQANAYYWTFNSTYQEAAFGTISASIDLDPTYMWTIQVSKAWQAVGIYAPNPEISFTADTTLGWVPFTVNFAGSSVLNVQDWTWNFGDGSNANTQSHAHLFDSAGLYDVTLEISADGEIKTLNHSNYIVALADTMIIDTVTTGAGAKVEISISLNNTVPLNLIEIPIEYVGDLNLSLDSFSTVGCRTDYFEVQQYIQLDGWNKRATILLQASYNATSEDLPIGSGTVLKVYFETSASAASGAVNQIINDGYLTYLPRVESKFGNYDVRIVNGSISIGGCCVGIRGNLNGDPLESIDISDLVLLVDYVFAAYTNPVCPEEDDVNGSGELDISDLVHLVDFIFGDPQGPAPASCF